MLRRLSYVIFLCLSALTPESPAQAEQAHDRYAQPLKDDPRILWEEVRLGGQPYTMPISMIGRKAQTSLALLVYIPFSTVRPLGKSILETPARHLLDRLQYRRARGSNLMSIDPNAYQNSPYPDADIHIAETHHATWISRCLSPPDFNSDLGLWSAPTDTHAYYYAQHDNYVTDIMYCRENPQASRKNDHHGFCTHVFGCHSLTFMASYDAAALPKWKETRTGICESLEAFKSSAE